MVKYHPVPIVLKLSSAGQSRARIEWLENIISTQLPHVDLTKGPQVDNEGPGSEGPKALSTADTQRAALDATMSSGIAGQKRAREIGSNDVPTESLNAEAQTVAMDLGMLTLGSDSREKHYMGSSSGLYFTHLLQSQSPPGESSSPRIAQTPRSGKRSTIKDYSFVYQKLSSTLPTRDDAIYLFDIYLRNLHADHPIVHPGSIFNALEGLYLSHEIGSGAMTGPSGWPLDTPAFAYNGELNGTNESPLIPISIDMAIFHVFMIFALASSSRLGAGQTDFAPTQFHRVAMSVSDEVLGESSIAGLQATYLLAMSSLMAPARLNLWILTHVCMAQSIDLGIHRQSKDSSTASTIRSLLFHSIYSLDRSVATIQGRPLGIRDETFDVQLPTMEELQTVQTSANLPTELQLVASDLLTYSFHRFRLDPIISEIKLLFYHLPLQSNAIIWSTDYDQQQQRIYTSLTEWAACIGGVCNQLPVADTEKRRWQLHLEANYHAAVVLLFQPSQTFRQPTGVQMELCFNAAADQLACYDSLYELEMLQLDWRTVRSIFACGATLIYAFWTSNSIQAPRISSRLPKSLKTCTTLLTVGGVFWPSVRRGKTSFERLVDLTLQKSRQTNVQIGRSSKRRLLESYNLSQNKIFEADFQPDLGGSSLQTDNRSEMPANLNFARLDQSNAFEIHEDESLNFNILPDDPFSDGPIAQGTHNLQMYDTLNMDGTPENTLDPEIEAFLSDYFVDDDGWNSANTGLPLEFRFGNL
ncbi:hypothetical protein LTR84_010959 [Exophiala bonariae]|uniref:Xylanolytic transcriptional activator regulatory domain-containing protein n=1 Tax=Exophiala bonariae TaxID=1690606 RepID=A0AAV9NJE1_9EURO|nr:hypothetical protein LTR84_010959 [Exophiala bonariae]